MLNRLYISHVNKAIKSNSQSFLYLSHLKLRTIAKKQGGRFTIEQAIDCLKLTKQTTIKHLRLINEVTKVRKNLYKLSTSKTRTGHELFNILKDEDLFKYSYKNISEFRALLCELEIERYKRHQKAVIKGYTVFNLKDKIKEKVKDGKNTRFHNMMAISCSSKLLNKSTATISRYKIKQKVSSYNWKANYDYLLSYPYKLKDGSINFKKIESISKGVFILDSSNNIFLSTPSTRTTSLTLRLNR